MSIFDRMGRVLSSNVNALLDKADDPRKSVDLLVTEMGEQVRQAKKELVAGLATEKTLRKKVEELDAEVERWERRAELALKSNDEALARDALLQKKRIVGERDRAEALRAEQRAAVLSMKGEVDRMEAKQKELEARKGTIAAQISTARAGGGPEALGARSHGGAFDEFRRMEAAIDHKTDEAAAAREIDEALGGGASAAQLEAKFRELEGGAAGSPTQSPEIDDEIARLKNKIRIGT
jgi:phage shock protein A